MACIALDVPNASYDNPSWTYRFISTRTTNQSVDDVPCGQFQVSLNQFC